MGKIHEHHTIDIGNKIEQGKNTYTDTEKILELLNHLQKENTETISDIKKIQNILKGNKKILTHQYCKSNRVRSVLHVVKYSSKMDYHIKQRIVNMMIDVGYNLFTFSLDSSWSDNCNAIFFIAAKGDYVKLQQIVDYFKSRNVEKIYDTREGDTVLSFMIKFGDYFQKEFVTCFRFMVQNYIDVERVDYYKKTIKDVIAIEKKILQDINFCESFIEKLDDMANIVNKHSQENLDFNSKISPKYKLFQIIIAQDSKKFTKYLTNELLNSDDGENTLLQLAIIKNDIESTKELLKRGADPNHVVKERNSEPPLVLAAKLGRIDIFKEILNNKNIEITENIFARFVVDLKKFLNYLLESKALDVNIEYKGKTPLYHAIIRKNKTAIQSLLQRGSRVDSTFLEIINPRDLETYFNSCIKDDTYVESMEESKYKSLLIFDFFINSSRYILLTTSDNENETVSLLNSNLPSAGHYYSEIAIIRDIGNNKRLKHLLEHPLLYIFIILKWHCSYYYYYCFVFLKFMFYMFIAILVYTEYFIIYIVVPVLLIQTLVVYYNYSEYEFRFKQYTLHFILEIIIYVCLLSICLLKALNFMLNEKGVMSIINQVSAFVIILTSVSILVTMGYHIKLSKWMTMAKKVFKSFSVLLLFFMIPIIAFATSFNLLLSANEVTKEEEKDNADFNNIFRATFRTIVMLGGDIGDKKFSVIGSYFIFLLFTVGMAIILVNFWTGVAVSDIKEIEEQSTIMAFINVIVFIESVERMYQMVLIKLKRYLPPQKYIWISNKIQLPFLKSRIALEEGRKFQYGINMYINAQRQFHIDYFEKCKIPNDIISNMKTLSEEKDSYVAKTLKELYTKLSKIEQLLQNQVNRNKKT